MEEIASSGIPEDQFRFLRDLEDIESYLRESAIVVNTSSVPESFGLSILEAMAHSRAVVVPANGAFPEFVEDERTGLFFQPGNVDSLAASILRLIRDPDLALRIGTAAHATVRDRFRIDQMADAMTEQYEICLGRPLAGGAASDEIN